MKMTIPENGKIAKDARECIQECVSEFISFITSEALDKSYSENRKTVNGDDLLYAFIALGFDNYVPPLQAYLRKYRESTKCDRNIVYSTIDDGECLGFLYASLVKTVTSIYLDFFKSSLHFFTESCLKYGKMMRNR